MSVSQTWQTTQDMIGNLRKGELENAQNKALELRSVRDHSRFIKKPSRLVYLLLLYLAVVSDILGIIFFFAAFTGVGVILTVIISILISISFFIVSLWLGRKIKNVRVSGETVANFAIRVEQRVQFYRTQTAQAIRLIRRTAAGRNILRSKIGRKTVGFIAKFGKKSSPLGRTLFALIAEIIPWLQVVPWYTINIYLTYREHKKEYKQSISAIQNYDNMSIRESRAFAEYQGAQVDVATEEPAA